MALQTQKTGDDNVMGVTLGIVGVLAVALLIAWAFGAL